MRSIIILLLAASFATAGTPDRAAWKKAWYRARRSESQVAFPTNGLVAYYSMDSVSGTTVFDTFGTNDLTTTGAPLFGSSYGKYLDGSDFNGTDQRMFSASDVAGLRVSTGFSLSVWANPDDITSRGAFASKYDFNNNQREWWVGNNGSAAGRVEFLSSDNGDAVNVYSVRTKSQWLQNGTWTHVVVTFDAGSITIYINGNSVPVETVLGIIKTTIFSGTSQVRIADVYATNHYNGQMDEIAYFNRALSSNEVSTIYNNGTGRFYTP